MRYALIIATVAAIATPALADDVGVRVGPVGAGATTVIGTAIVTARLSRSVNRIATAPL